jgi:hypothetical protein
MVMYICRRAHRDADVHGLQRPRVVDAIGEEAVHVAVLPAGGDVPAC